MVNYSFFSLLNLVSSYSARLCGTCGSKPYGALRIRIEIVLPGYPLKWYDSIAWRTNHEPLQVAITDQTMIKRNILV